MILQLDETNRVFGAEKAWELQSLRVSKGKQEWRAYKWFGTLAEALREAARAEIRTYPCEGVVQALEAVERVTAKYAALIDGVAERVAERAQKVAA